uniref:Uncharacterized protein n=1 Tax=Alexandrium catenella TaxID=2925 RepID=A0A7S1SAU7_ALECA
MGCGGSVHQLSPTADAKSGKLDQEVQALGVATWATKAEVRASPGHHAVGSTGNRGSDRSRLTMVDADDESDVEVIYEGKTALSRSQIMAASCANGQEAPEVPEPFEASQGKFDEPVLSKIQQEEAAKLAEQRKRFNNQRYRKELATPSSHTPTCHSPSPGSPLKAPTETPRHDLVMGLNLSQPPACQEAMLTDCLPGGVFGDTPREEAPMPTKVRNKHEVFDDDDELLMKEILDSIDV